MQCYMQGNTDICMLIICRLLVKSQLFACLVEFRTVINHLLSFQNIAFK